MNKTDKLHPLVSDALASALVRDGFVSFANERRVIFRTESDNNTELNDFDYLGKIAHVIRNPYSGQHKPRPEGFDGRAEIIRTPWTEVWWQPPFDYESLSIEVRDQVRQTAKDVIAFGFDVYIVELCEGLDAYGKPIVVKYRDVAGIEPMLSNEDKVSTVSELLNQLADANGDLFPN